LLAIPMPMAGAKLTDIAAALTSFVS